MNAILIKNRAILETSLLEKRKTFFCNIEDNVTTTLR